MKNLPHIKFYYEFHEYEPSIIMIDELNKEAYYILEMDITYIEKIDFPLKKDLNRIIKQSTKELYDGSLSDIKFILDKGDIKVLEGLAKSKNRSKYIIRILNKAKNVVIQKETIKEVMRERILELFEGQEYKYAIKYRYLYDKMIEYIKNLTDQEVTNLYNMSEKMSHKDLLYHLLVICEIPKNNINERHFSI